MIKISKKIIRSMLVIYMAMSLVGCTASKSAAVGCGSCAKKKPKVCKTQPKKITCDTLNTPYDVVGNGRGCPPMSLVKQNLMTASGNNDNDAAIGALRASALRETALSIGARGGLAERACKINRTLLNYEPLLAKIFQFYGLLLDDNILPPVLIEGRNTLNLAGTDAIRIADRNYKVITQARFVTAPPTWREYLWMSYDAPELPDRSLLPKTKPERIMWERDLEDGWQAGLKQADLIYTENINRLVRDFNGMILYRKLLAQNMVSAPFVAKLDMGITGDGNDMSINDKVLRITAFPQLQTSSDDWKTELHIYE